MKHLVCLLVLAGAFVTTAPAEATEPQTSTQATTEEAMPAPAAPSSISADIDITYVCMHNSNRRTIKVVYHDEGPDVCEVIYEKSTGTKTLWNASNDKSYCEDKAIEFVTKQEGWGWQCNQQ